MVSCKERQIRCFYFEQPSGLLVLIFFEIFNFLFNYFSETKLIEIDEKGDRSISSFRDFVEKLSARHPGFCVQATKWRWNITTDPERMNPPPLIPPQTYEKCATQSSAGISPQDIEWALANEKFYILQSRPITALSY